MPPIPASDPERLNFFLLIAIPVHLHIAHGKYGVEHLPYLMVTGYNKKSEDWLFPKKE